MLGMSSERTISDIRSTLCSISGLKFKVFVRCVVLRSIKRLLFQCCCCMRASRSVSGLVCWLFHRPELPALPPRTGGKIGAPRWLMLGRCVVLLRPGSDTAEAAAECAARGNAARPCIANPPAPAPAAAFLFAAYAVLALSSGLAGSCGIANDAKVLLRRFSTCSRRNLISSDCSFARSTSLRRVTRDFMRSLPARLSSRRPSSGTNTEARETQTHK